MLLLLRRDDDVPERGDPLMRAVCIACLFVACGAGTSVNPNLPTVEELAAKWTVVAAPLGDYFAIHGSAADNIYIVGRGGRILHYDGQELSEVTSPTTEHLFSVFVVSPTRAFACGNHGTVIAWDGETWSVDGTGTSEELRGIWADATSALAVGANATAIARGGGVWQPVPTNSPDDLFAIVRSGNNTFAVGTLGTIATSNGTSFTRPALAGFPKTLVAAHAGPGGTFIGGVDGAVFDRGRGNARIAGIQSSFVRSISAPGGAMYVVGWDGLLARVGGATSLLHYPDAGKTWLYGVWASDPTDVWVVGADGMILRGPPLVDPVVAR